jgi:IPT/TIG domain
MLCRTRSLLLAGLLAPLLLSGCNNTLNPLCTSARPAPLIGSISPSTMTFAQVQQGVELVVNGSNFVSSTEVMINSTPLGASVVSSTQLKVKVSSDVISGPGQVKVMVQTPSGNTGDLGCTSGGKSSVLVLTVH